MRVIQNYHMDTQGWNDIAYNFAVCPHGYVFVGRDHGVRSSANGTNSGNAESEAVCYLGGIGDEYTLEGERAHKEIMDEISDIQRCHNYWFNTMCPGPEICNEIKNGFPKVHQTPAPKPKDESVKYVYVQPQGDGRVFAARHGEEPVHVVNDGPGTYYADYEALASYQGDEILSNVNGHDIPDNNPQGAATRKVLVLTTQTAREWYGV